MVVEKNDITENDNTVTKRQEAGDLTSDVVVTIEPDIKINHIDEETDHLLMTNNGNIRKNIGKVVLSLHDVDYKICNTKCCGGKRVDLKILQDINGTFKPGINAILGTTGSGKTTLLNVLAGRSCSANTFGKVLLNGQKLPKNFKNIAGYVIQDDMVMSMLTVRENITFSANLRLEGIMTIKERKGRVDDVINDLGLSGCADTRIGTYYKRGVSGGERKRTCIAMELITSSQVLFLDEPTTGLDASTAHSVMSLLKTLANRGMTIVLTIHQPRYSIFKMFDRLFVLSAGQSVYHGPSNECLEFFASAGYVIEEHDNPSDFILDVLSGTFQSSTSKTLAIDPPVADAHTVEGSDNAKTAHEFLVEHYKHSQWADKVKTELKNEENVSISSEEVKIIKSQKSASFCKQLMTVSKRTWQSTMRNRHALMTQIFSAIVLSLIVGSIYFQIDKSTSDGYVKIQNRVGAFFFIIMNYVFGNMSAVDLFIKERAIYIHEVVSGYYCILAYYLAKLFFDVFPQRFIPINLFAIITFFMIGLHLSVSQFFFYFLNILLTSIAGTSVALFFSATTRQHTIGTVLTSLVWVIMMVYSGVLVNVETIPYFLQWISWLSIFRYSMNGFLVNEIKDMSFCNEHPLNNSSTTYCLSGNTYLDNQGIQHRDPIHLWANEIGLLVITVVFLLLTFIQLRRSVRANC